MLTSSFSQNYSAFDTSFPSVAPVRPLSAYNYYFRQHREAWSMEHDQTKEGEESNIVTTGACDGDRKDVIDRKISPSLPTFSTAQPPPVRKFEAMAKAMGEQWRTLPDAQRQAYTDLAAADKERYRVEMKEHRDKQIRESAMAQAFLKRASTATANGTESGMAIPNLKLPPPESSEGAQYEKPVAPLVNASFCPETLPVAHRGLDNNIALPSISLPSQSETDFLLLQHQIQNFQQTQQLLNRHQHSQLPHHSLPLTMAAAVAAASSAHLIPQPHVKFSQLDATGISSITQSGLPHQWSQSSNPTSLAATGSNISRATTSTNSNTNPCLIGSSNGRSTISSKARAQPPFSEASFFWQDLLIFLQQLQRGRQEEERQLRQHQLLVAEQYIQNREKNVLHNSLKVIQQLQQQDQNQQLLQELQGSPHIAVLLQQLQSLTRQQSEHQYRQDQVAFEQPAHHVRASLINSLGAAPPIACHQHDTLANQQQLSQPVLRQPPSAGSNIDVGQFTSSLTSTQREQLVLLLESSLLHAQLPPPEPPAGI